MAATRVGAKENSAPNSNSVASTSARSQDHAEGAEVHDLDRGQDFTARVCSSCYRLPPRLVGVASVPYLRYRANASANQWAEASTNLAVCQNDRLLRCTIVSFPATRAQVTCCLARDSSDADICCRRITICSRRCPLCTPPPQWDRPVPSGTMAMVECFEALATKL